MQDKIVLLMEETGCDQGEAELALEMCGFEVEKAVKAIPRLLKNIVVLKGKFINSDQHQFGLILVVLNLKLQTLLRSRAVLSYNPAVYSVSLEEDWFGFEKHLYGCRLWEGSLQTESQEIEQRLANYFRTTPDSAAYVPSGAESVGKASSELSGLLEMLFQNAQIKLNLKKEILDLGSFQSLRSDPEAGGTAAVLGKKEARSGGRSNEPLILKIALEEDSAGVSAGELRAGDIVLAQINDFRDIAQYLSKIFGGYSEKGPQAIAAPVEAIEAASGAQSGLMVRVRFAVGVCGDAMLPKESRVKLVVNERQKGPWWRKFFGV